MIPNMSDGAGKILYGRDLLFSSPEAVRVNSISFSGYDDVELISTADFLYNTFRIEGADGDFALYESAIWPDSGKLPVASFFHHDRSELDYIARAAQFDCAPIADARSGRMRRFARSFGVPLDSSAQSDSLIRTVSTSFTVAQNTDKAPYSAEVGVSRDKSGMLVVRIEAGYCEFLSDHLRRVLGIEDVIVMRRESPAGDLNARRAGRRELSRRHFLSALRACAIALKACVKFSCPVAFEFDPICQTPQVDAVITSQIHMPEDGSGGGSVIIDEECSVTIRACGRNMFQKELVFSVADALTPAYPTESLKMSISIDTSAPSYSMDPGDVIHGKLLSWAMAHQSAVAEAAGYDRIFSGLGAKAGVFRQSGKWLSPEEAEMVWELLDDSRFFSKAEMFSGIPKAASELSAARRLSRRVTCVIVCPKQGALCSNRISSFGQVCLTERRGDDLFSARGFALFMAEYNAVGRIVFNMSALVTIRANADEDEEKAGILRDLRKAMGECSIRTAEDFEDAKIDIRFIKGESASSPGPAVFSFVSYVKELMDNEDQLRD